MKQKSLRQGTKQDTENKNNKQELRERKTYNLLDSESRKVNNSSVRENSLYDVNKRNVNRLYKLLNSRSKEIAQI